MNFERHYGEKARGNDFPGRFREIISDPLNLAIKRSPLAGFTDGALVFLHNGIRVPISGPNAYYGDFSSILVINRGVHEPLEEFAFQEVIRQLPVSPFMLELGAYWGHYSMWLKTFRPGATVHLVEPESQNIKAGIENFELNGLHGEFIQAFVGKGHFGVDKYLSEKRIERIDILHSDIQGFELEMLEGSTVSLGSRRIDYLFISTHSQQLHHDAVGLLRDFGYRVEISSDFDFETTSFDGFIFASSPSMPAIFKDFYPMGRKQILEASPSLLLEYLSNVIRHTGGQSKNA